MMISEIAMTETSGSTLEQAWATLDATALMTKPSAMHEHHLHDGQQHADIADVDALAGKQQHERRGDDRGHDGGARGHADGQRHVTLGQVRHDVGGGAAGAAADKHDAHGKLGGQLEDQAQYQAISGMMMNWDRMPVITAFGLVNTTLKSPS